MSRSNAIPELVKIGSIPTNMTQEIETAIQEPVVADENTIRFSIHKRGFIHSNSKLILSLDSSGEASTWFLPVNIGIGSLIKNVAFRIGDTTIQEVQDWAELHAYRSLFIAGESNKEKEQYTSQRLSNFDVQYNRYKPVNAIALPEGEGEELDTGKAPTYAFVGASDPTRDNTDQVNKTMHTFQFLDNEPTYQISLQDLVPFFKQNQLPAWIINPDIYLDITLQDGLNRCCCTTGAASDQYVHTINETQTKLIIDHIFYPGDVMEAWRNANKKVQFTYFDYRLSKMSLTEAQCEQQIVRNIGGAGRIVTKVICALMNEKNATLAEGGANAKSLLNKFNAQCSQRLFAANNETEAQGKTTSNLKFNDHFLYPVDRDNTAVHFYDVTQSEGIVPFVTRDLYSGETNTTGQSLFMSHEYRLGLKGRFFWQSWRLNRSERISSRGIELYQLYNDVPALPTPATDTYTLRCWLEVLKYATLEDGKMECYFA